MTLATTRALLILPLLVLAACDVPPPATPPATPDPSVQCKADDYKALIGQPKSVLTTMLLPAGTRVIGPGDAVTMDYRADRVNIELGASGRIEKISCY